MVVRFPGVSERFPSRVRRAVLVVEAVALSLLAHAVLLGLPSAAFGAAITSRVSVTTSGGQANSSSGAPTMTDDGRFVVFRSTASNLVVGDTNGIGDVFVRDRAARTTERVSVTSGGAQVTASSSFAGVGHAISADGRFVVFATTSPGILAGDDASSSDVFVRDRHEQTTTHVSKGAQPSITPDGRFVAFTCTNCSAQFDHSYVFDRQSGNRELVSYHQNGAPCPALASSAPTISDDGRFVAMHLACSGTGDYDAIYIRDRQFNTSEILVDTHSTRSEVFGISANGQLILIRSSAALVIGDTNGVDDFFTIERVSNVLQRVSLGIDGGQMSTQALVASLSPNGRWVIFQNVVGGVYLRDRVNSTTEVLDRTLAGTLSGAIGTPGWVSNDGRFAAFSSNSAGLVAGDTNGASDVFLRDRLAPTPPAIPIAQTIGGCANSLGATDCEGESLDEEVDGANGGLSQSVTDARLAGRGISFAFTRSYSSTDTQDGRLGPGWTFPYQAAVSVYLNGDVAVRAEDGQQGTFVRQPDGSFAAPPGVTSTLTAAAGGYTLTALDQTRLSFNLAGELVGMVDQAGQGLTFVYTAGDMTGVSDADGRQVTLTYDPVSHRLTGIRLPDGRTVGYGYLPDGHLGNVTDVRGGVTTYTYNADGRLDGVRDPLGHWTVRAVYDATGRIIEHRNALDNLTTYSWDEVTGTHSRTDPRGGVWQEVYRGNVLIRTIDPVGNTVVYGYDERLNQVAVTDARGNARFVGYDDRGNIVGRTTAAPLLYSESWTYDAQNRPLTHTNARGYTTTYEYYPNGDLWKETNAKGGVTEYTYTPERQVATVRDPRGNTTTNAYDPVTKKLIRTTTPLGNATVYEYDAFGRLSGQIDPRGQVQGANPALFRTSFTYNDADQQTSVRDARGNMTITTYDLAGREETVTDALGKVTVYGYDAANRRTSVTDPKGGVTQTEYDQAGNITATVTPTGDRTTYAFDLAGRQTSMTSPRGNVTGATASDYTWNYTYDANGNRTVVRDPLANETTTGYDALNRPTSVTDPRGKTTTTAYDANGNVVSVTNPMGHVSASSYDELDRKATTTTPRGKVGSTTYDAVGNVVSETTPLGNTTTWTFDNDNRVATMVEPRGNLANGTPATYTWTYTYDPAGNRLTEKSPLNHITTTTYDASNNQTTRSDALGHVTTWTHDALNRLQAVTGPDAPVCTAGVECVGGKKSTVYGYDDAGNLVSRTDPKAHVTGYSYDAAKRLKQTLSPTNQKWTYGYDPDGNQTQIITARGNANAPNTASGTISKVFDRRGKLTNINFGDGTTPNVVFAYDNAGRLQSMTDGAGTETYTLDDANRVTQITRGTESFAYVYDNDGNVTKRTYPDTTAHDATFDDDGRISSITSGGVVTSFTYDAAGNLTRTTLPAGNGHLENRTIDAAGRVIKVESIKGTKVLVGVTQTLDAVGNPTLIATKRGNTTTNQTFAYDAADRITRNCLDITTACTAAAAKRIEYTYDPIGNRLTQNRVGVTTPGSTTYTYNDADQLTQTVAGTTTTTYGYDADGNQTSSGAKGYVYDLANRLTRFCPATTTCTNTVTGRTDYTYDGQGRRLTKATSGVVDTRFSWDTVG